MSEPLPSKDRYHERLDAIERRLDEVLENQRWTMARQRDWRGMLLWLRALVAVWTIAGVGAFIGVIVLLTRGG